MYARAAAWATQRFRDSSQQALKYDSVQELRMAKVAVIGAGAVGSTVAQRIAEQNLADVVLLDIVAGRPQGLALDLMEARGVLGHDREIVGTQDYAAIAGVDVVVVTAGLPRQPGMSRDELAATNAAIVRQVMQQVGAVAPFAIAIIVTNPLDAMTYLAWQVSGWPRQRVLGMAGVLDAARFATFIAMEMNVSVADINAMVLGGHGDLMVPLPRYTTVRGIPLPELLSESVIDHLVARTRDGGGEIGRLLQAGSAYYAPAAAVTEMVDAIVNDRQRYLPAAAILEGEYGHSDLAMGVPVCLGRHGLESIVTLTLTETEQAAFDASAASVKHLIQQLS